MDANGKVLYLIEFDEEILIGNMITKSLFQVMNLTIWQNSLFDIRDWLIPPFLNKSITTEKEGEMNIWLCKGRKNFGEEML
ncbi:hypothetical protein [Bacillus sp. S0628]|uniref:hypothetical protein n=1 Tax=Bacillus sp. S0628 TaxID=2957802 RepID=UPI00209CCA0B|nr:hypothetical protein [Bacillus sp. S0628]